MAGRPIVLAEDTQHWRLLRDHNLVQIVSKPLQYVFLLIVTFAVFNFPQDLPQPAPLATKTQQNTILPEDVEAIEVSILERLVNMPLP